MARFPFSINSRKKLDVAPPPNVPPLSKAHKILGSIPLSIDTPGSWDDASCPRTADDGSPTIAVSYATSEMRGYVYDHPSVVTKSDEPWRGETDVVPNSLRPNGGGYREVNEGSKTDTSGTLKKSRSSSTIRSWYDKSKLPLSISQQTSSSAMAKGLPSSMQLAMKGSHDVEDGSKTKKKPAKLDLSRTALSAGDAAGRGLDTGSGTDFLLPTPSSMSPFSPMSARSRDSRWSRKKNLWGDPSSPVPETPRPETSASRHLSPGTLRELPSLYDHYEQMSMRQVMKQTSTPTLRMTESGLLTLDNVAERTSEDEPMAAQQLQFPVVPQTPSFSVSTKSDSQSSPGDGARSVSSRHTKTSRASRSTDRSIEVTNLQQTSVLMLSSDSEDDDAVESVPRVAQVPAPSSTRRRLRVEDNSPSREEETLPKTAYAPKTGDNGRSRSIKQGKRTSFAASDTYITIPSPVSDRGIPTTLDSRSRAPFSSLSPAASSPRASVRSSLSVKSGTTWQERSGYGIQEARAITMLPARRASRVGVTTEQERSPVMNGESPRESRLHRSTSTDQLTPPLSPTSVDFYIRSTRGSVEESGSQSRLMAVTYQEEMFLSALRHKQSAMRKASMSQVSEENEPATEEEAESSPGARRESHPATSTGQSKSQRDGRRKKGHQSQGSQTTITGSIIDFGFPAPPSFKESTKVQKQRASGRRKSSSALAPLQTQNLVPQSGPILPKPSGPPPTLALPALPKQARNPPSSSSSGTTSSQSQQDMSQYFYDAEPSPTFADIRDWELATSPVVETMTPDALLDVPWPERNRGRTGGKRARSIPRTDSRSRPSFHANTWPTSNSNNTSPDREEDQSSYEGRDVPRPDSPVSPGSFPAVPMKRTTLSNMARLSAVGPGFLSDMGEAGWWGDDD